MGFAMPNEVYEESLVLPNGYVAKAHHLALRDTLQTDIVELHRQACLFNTFIQVIRLLRGSNK